jgi:AraC family transcriptional regulator of adaptative response / DNA-3-methyladenine glycosylase II
VILDRAEGLDRLSDSLSSIAGLGPWTANYIALRLGEPDAFPASDLGVRRGLAASGERPLATREAEALAERWRPWRAHATTLLWLKV